MTHQPVGSSDPLVVRVGPDGTSGSPVRRSVAHSAPGILHLAVSVQVVDRDGRGWLLQRRSASKLLFPRLFANSCCTHPVPGEDPARAAARRLREETGVIVDKLVEAGSFTYRAIDASSGLVEHEQDRVFVALADTRRLQGDPQEVDELIVVPFGAALTLTASDEGAPWAAPVLRLAHRALDARWPGSHISRDR